MNLPPSVVRLMHSMNTYGSYDIASPSSAYGDNILSYGPESQSERNVTSKQKPEITIKTVADPAPCDVINGRGQGVQRHPGNEKYRELVSRNKVVYAKCPRSDKAKISRAIVAAVREFGGRFLELDERSGGYRDIGDKKAVAKTSQALREGQTKIRKKMLRESDTSPLARGNPGPLAEEEYLRHNVQILESLYNQETNAPGLSLPTIEKVVPKPPTRAAKEPNETPRADGAHSKPATDEEVIKYSLRVLGSQPLYETEKFALPPLPDLQMELNCPSFVSEDSSDKAEAEQSDANNLKLLARICSV